MPLAGTFDVLDFAGALTLLASRACTGSLHVRAGHLHGTIKLSEGHAVGAVRMEGNRGDARNNWRSLLDDICFEALRAGRGSFEFVPEEVGDTDGPRVKLETVVAAARKRLAEWREVETVIPSLDAVPRLSEGLRASSVTLDQDHWRLLVAIDGRHSVTALARRLDMTLLRFCQLIKPLVDGGAVILESTETKLKALPSVRLDPEHMESEHASFTEGRVSVTSNGAAEEAGATSLEGPPDLVRRTVRVLTGKVHRQQPQLQMAVLTPPPGQGDK